ncbi:MAG: DUF362 domain-containing protein [Candidatus Hodarchaeota archaeon]
MKIDSENCTGCGICLPYCNVGAISLRDEVASIDQDVCVECWVCYTNRVCPKHCFEPTGLVSYGEVFKHVLSYPVVTSKGTGVPGRGTEEAKTNDVTGRYNKDVYGICVDMGRPGVGVYMREVEKVAIALADAGVRFASPNETPLSAVMSDMSTGRLREDILDVHVLSVIIEGICERKKIKSVLNALLKLETEIDTVFSLGIVSMMDDNGDAHLMRALEQSGIRRPTRGKVNVGLGRPLFPD